MCKMVAQPSRVCDRNPVTIYFQDGTLYLEDQIQAPVQMGNSSHGSTNGTGSDTYYRRKDLTRKLPRKDVSAHLAVRFTFFFAFARCNDFARSGKASILLRATI